MKCCGNNFFNPSGAKKQTLFMSAKFKKKTTKKKDDSSKLYHYQNEGKKKWPDQDTDPGPRYLPIRETTELLSQWPTFDIFPLAYIYLSPNLLITEVLTRRAFFYACGPSCELTLSHQFSQERKKSRPDQDLNPGPLAIRETN